MNEAPRGHRVDRCGCRVAGRDTRSAIYECPTYRPDHRPRSPDIDRLIYHAPRARRRGDRMKRREFMAVLGGATVWPVAARGQQPAKVAQIGFLGAASGHSALAGRTLDAFRQGLQDLGYTEGRNIAIEERHADLDFDRLRDLAAELVRLDVAVIVAVPTPSAVAARSATGSIPIVMIAVGDPVRQGLVTSLAHPGGNVTGLSFTVSMETFGKGLE